MKNSRALNNDIQYICSNIMESDYFNRLYGRKHHFNSNVAIHSIRVTNECYRLAHIMHLDIDKESLIKGAICHDLALANIKYTFGPKQAIFHSMDSANIATNIIGTLSDKERNIIESHMFPISPVLPKYKESWILTLVDKYIATKEILIEPIIKILTINKKGKI